jgi:starvation-inducible DNA-binding protein
MAKSSPAEKGTQDDVRLALQDTFTLYAWTHGAHWNVTGPHFATLHALFETQYNELWAALDPIAERLRALGVKAPGTAADLAHGRLRDPQAVPREATALLKQLLAGNEALAAELRQAARRAAEAGDDATADLFIGRIDAHDKHAWMLRASLA